MLVTAEDGITTKTYSITVTRLPENLGFDSESDVPVTADGFSAHFDIDPFIKHCLLNGLDDIALTLEHADAIDGFERDRPLYSPVTR